MELADGFVVKGSQGQPRLSAAVTEVRQGRLALARLLAELRLPDVDEVVGVNPVRQRAARARWNARRDRRLAAVAALAVRRSVSRRHDGRRSLFLPPRPARPAGPNCPRLRDLG
jgi:hypothetical protein